MNWNVGHRRRDGSCAARLAGWFVLLAMVLLIAGCSKQPQSPPSVSVLHISQRNEPTDLDPATASLPDEFFIIRALSEGLLVPNPTGGSPLPAAAERYEISSDGLTYTFHLRPNALWSNGERVTAQDFIASFQRVLTPATAAPKAHLFYAVKNARAFATGTLQDFSSVGIAAPNDNTVVITLDHPVADFPLYVASGVWIPVNPRVVEHHGRHWTQPGNFVGNGPFLLAEWRPQQRIVVRRNLRYRDPGSVRLDEIQFIRFDSGDTEERAFRAGQIDVTMAVPQSKLEFYARDRGDELFRAPLAETRFLSFNTRRTPLNDARIRRALALAIDRKKIVEFVLRGGQEPATRFLSPALLGKAATRTAGPKSVHRYDPNEARRLLAEAGFPNGSGFPKLELAGWVQNPALDAFQQMWRQELGITTEIVIQEAKVHLAAVNAGNYDIAFVTNLLDVRDPVSALADFVTDAPNNFPHWSSGDYDRLIESAGRQQVPTRALADCVAAENLILEAAAVSPVYFNTQNWLMSAHVQGWQQDALWSRRYNEVWLVDR